MYASPIIKNLGAVYFDRPTHLSFKKHVEITCKSANWKLRNISLMRKYLDQKSCKVLVHAFVTSKLDYLNSLLFGLPECQIRKLQMIMNTAARIVKGAKRRCHVTPLLKDLHWLPIDYRIKFKILMLAFRAYQLQQPVYLANFVSPYHPVRTLRSTNKFYLCVPRPRIKSYGFRSFTYSAASLWNQLPDHLRTCSDLSTFKRLLKTHFFCSAF